MDLGIFSFLLCYNPPASRKEKSKSQKQAYKAYTKLAEQEEQCKEKMASCETRDVRSRQVMVKCVSLFVCLSVYIPTFVFGCVYVCKLGLVCERASISVNVFANSCLVCLTDLFLIFDN